MSRAASARLRGVIAAIPTPVSGAQPDPMRLIKLARHLLRSGCDGLNVLGTTGEATSFSVDQRMGVMSAVKEAGLPMDRLMVGTGAAAVADAIRLSQYAAELGFAGILLLPPFYYKNVADEGLIAYVTAVVRSTAAVPIPIYLYNFPALSGVSFSLALIARLMEECGARIAGLKDSSGDIEYAKAVTVATPLDVFPSSEACLPLARAGVFAGCISATANVNSMDCASAYLSGDQAALLRATTVRKLFENVPLVPGVKYLLSELHSDACLSDVMPPLTQLTPDQAKVVRGRYNDIPAIPVKV